MLPGMKLGGATVAGGLVASAIIGFSLGQIGAAFVDSGKGATVGDWLAFVGSLLGTAFAVAGAVYVETWKRSSDTRRSARMLLHTVTYLQSPLAQIEYAHGDDLPPVRAHALYSMALFALLEAEPAFNHARDLLRIEDFRLYEALRALSAQFDMARAHQARLRNIAMDDDEKIRGMLEVTVFWPPVLKHAITNARTALQELT
jgi:hypothetical protein